MKRNKPIEDERKGAVRKVGGSGTPVTGTMTRRSKLASKVEESGTAYSTKATNVEAATKVVTKQKSADVKKKVLADYVIEGKGAIYLLDIKPAGKLKNANTNLALIDIIRAGVTKRSYDKMLNNTGLTSGELSDIIHISDRTLRRYTPDQAFPPEQSNRMVELAMLYSRGAEVFESIDRFKEWMSRPQLVFGNKLPKAYLDTSIGIGLIMDELGRIEHGIFA